MLSKFFTSFCTANFKRLSRVLSESSSHNLSSMEPFLNPAINYSLRRKVKPFESTVNGKSSHPHVPFLRSFGAFGIEEDFLIGTTLHLLITLNKYICTRTIFIRLTCALVRCWVARDLAAHRLSTGFPAAAMLPLFEGTQYTTVMIKLHVNEIPTCFN